MTLAELQALDAGFRFPGVAGDFPFRERGVRVPTLAELLEACPDVPLNIEIKQEEPAIEDAVLATLDRYGARARVLLAAEEGRIMDRIRAAAPDVLTGFSALDVLGFVTAWHGGEIATYRPPGIALQIPPSFGDVALVTAESVALAHDLGLEVHVWTIDDAAEMDALLDLGVDAIMTDVPLLGAAVLRRRGPR
jgi:glycerophosphoryl diester phosphodiesterase